eukprot:scaffold6881_cov126-Cylindrotheca_fusiformis.AAC.1
MKPVIRTITGFLSLESSDFSDVSFSRLESKVSKCVEILRKLEQEFRNKGYSVQTIRIATNPFGQWLLEQETASDRKKPGELERLETLNILLEKHDIHFCSLGPAMTLQDSRSCCDIIAASKIFSCSMNVEAGSVDHARGAASIILAISRLGSRPDSPEFLQDGQGNFRFCAVSNCKPFIPFFPAAKGEASDSTDVKFAVGLENGAVAQAILENVKSIGEIQDRFGREFSSLLLPIQELCEKAGGEDGVHFVGIDSSLNPSLEEKGSVASAIEKLTEVPIFGGPGTVAAAAQLTTALQDLEGITLTGYCGLMLPVCEDVRLAELAGDNQTRKLRITDLLSVSSVCGVGLDTVPLPGDCSEDEISSLVLDMAGVAGRWKKSLSCRLFPVPGKNSGDMTSFDSPYLVNACVFSLM